MFDVTSGEVGKIIRLSLQSVDESQNPPVISPLNLTNAASITLQYAWGSIYRPVGALAQVSMSIVDPINGIVQYVFQGSDLTAPPGFDFTGKIEYVVKVTFNNGNVDYSSDIGILQVKEKVGT